MTPIDEHRFDEHRRRWARDGVTAATVVTADIYITVRASSAFYTMASRIMECAGIDHNRDLTIGESAQCSRSWLVARRRGIGRVTVAEIDALFAHCGLEWAA